MMPKRNNLPVPDIFQYLPDSARDALAWLEPFVRHYYRSIDVTDMPAETEPISARIAWATAHPGVTVQHVRYDDTSPHPYYPNAAAEYAIRFPDGTRWGVLVDAAEEPFHEFVEWPPTDEQEASSGD